MSDKWRYAALVAVALVCVVICVFGWVVYDRTVVPRSEERRVGKEC